MTTWKLLKVVATKNGTDGPWDQYQLHIGQEGSSKRLRFSFSVDRTTGKTPSLGGLREAQRRYPDETSEAIKSIRCNP